MIRTAIYGYGNIGKGVEFTLSLQSDMELCAIFTRRDPLSLSIHSDVPVYPVEKALSMKNEIDILILCGGSATDLPVMTPELARSFNVIDSFDTHANIPKHFHEVDQAALESGHAALISAGWDPGLFSIQRLLGDAVLPEGTTYTFWGPGVSQGHSDAIRRIPGVKDARQYTIPLDEALLAVRSGMAPSLSTRQKHKRDCYVVAEEGADLAAIEKAIVTMPHYFDEYDTTVHFVSMEELARDHASLPHGGMVIRSGRTGWQAEHHHRIEFQLELDSNPEFASGAIVAYARGLYRLYQEGKRGCFTVFDVPPAYLSPKSQSELIHTLL